AGRGRGRRRPPRVRGTGRVAPDRRPAGSLGRGPLGDRRTRRLAEAARLGDPAELRGRGGGRRSRRGRGGTLRGRRRHDGEGPARDLLWSRVAGRGARGGRGAVGGLPARSESDGGRAAGGGWGGSRGEEPWGSADARHADRA